MQGEAGSAREGYLQGTSEEPVQILLPGKATCTLPDAHQKKKKSGCIIVRKGARRDTERRKNNKRLELKD